MKHLNFKVLAGVFVCGLLALISTANASPSLASAEPREIVLTLKFLRGPVYTAAVPTLLPLLHHESANVVRDTCRTLAVIGNKDVIPDIEPLLKDSRGNVRKDAQDAINALSGEHHDSTNKPPPSLSSYLPPDIIRTLKLLRSPEFSAATPAILPLLHHESANVVRDTCRTLAVIANKEVIPDIEPLLKDSRSDVRKDAQDAIDKLRAHP